LLNHTHLSQPLKVFFFGGAEGVAAAAADNINARKNGVICTGALCPGFGSVEEMSADHIIDEINASNAHILAVALGAAKAHAWLQRNQDRIKIPIRAHLGATINFQAGTYRRAPKFMQEWGFEWLWRLKEEPWLWRRYLTDSIVLGRIMLTNVLPLIVLGQWHRLQWARTDDLTIERFEEPHQATLAISGFATTLNLGKATPYLQEAAAAGKDVVINLAGTLHIDARFIGSFLVLFKRLKEQGRTLALTAVPRPIERLIRLNGFTFLL
jgi:N-acetylglucosaminyldiphosphoundecaprenol N-acetyl-beta-D-mannosaminyltransferase